MSATHPTASHSLPQGEIDAEASTSAETPATVGSPDAASIERMARLRQLVRVDGMSAEEAAAEIGVDPIIAQLWLRLPDDLLPATRGTFAGVETATGSSPLSAPMSGLRRVVTCRVPTPAYDRLRTGEVPLLEAAATALETALTLPLPEQAPGGWRFTRRPLAVPISAATFDAVTQLAAEQFRGDARDAAGWLIARGLGMALPLPTADELAGITPAKAVPTVTARQAAPSAAPTRFVVPPRRRPEARAPLPPDDSAPSGEELRQRRDAVGISQRDLAAASGLSRGLVAEVERGRRRHVLTRLRISETLASLERSK
jgi:DNA-binding XRE family transcriptional regulator